MYSYDYMMEEEILEFMEEFGYTFLGIILGIALIAMVVALVMYIFQSVGLYTIAKRRGIKHAWLSWLPIGYYWIAGSIADQYQYVAKGKIKNKRKILMILTVATLLVSVIMNLVSALVTFSLEDMDGIMTVSTMCSVAASLLRSGCSIALFVFWQMALYDLYSSVNPDSNVLFLVLGIFFSFLVPFFIFFNRKKEDGMPPRRSEPQEQIPPQPRYEEPREPWDEPQQL